MTLSRRARLHAPIIGLVIFVLLAALWAALGRIGWRLPPLPVPLLGQHGALMISGFLGTLVSLERAVALQKRWAYAVPILSALGSVALFSGLPNEIGRGLIALAALGLMLVFVFIYRLRSTIDMGTMAVGAVMWLIGNALWLFGQPAYHAAGWWAGFLILTIAGERLELSRVLILNERSRNFFKTALAVFSIGLLASLIVFDVGLRLAGAGLILFGAWLLRFDVARRTIRKDGLTRFIAACLLPGYVWLMIGGALWLIVGGTSTNGFLYDAMYHALFLGFVFSMIFGHAPIIIPSVMPIDVIYRPRFYLHLALLQLSLIMRVIADLFAAQPVRQWAGLLNVLAILFFLGNMIRSLRKREG
ncbi:MAG: hypothetical protein HY870_05535 [Chloroflexi bacterium]|nr:hypothetical protein [Chloroflexota bacterium]